MTIDPLGKRLFYFCFLDLAQMLAQGSKRGQPKGDHIFEKSLIYWANQKELFVIFPKGTSFPVGATLRDGLKNA